MIINFFIFDKCIIMNPTYNDENTQLLPPQVAPVHHNVSFMDYFKNNKGTVIIVLIILIALIWWFCFRKGEKTSEGNPFNRPSRGENPASVQITKSRLY